MTTMPVQKPGRSRQDYPTPRLFLDVVEKEFGPMNVDLACTRENCKGHDGGLYFPEIDSLQVNWRALAEYKNLWLNPPYKNITDLGLEVCQSTPITIQDLSAGACQCWIELVWHQLPVSIRNQILESASFLRR